jgi:hypothetical protein
LVTTSAAVSSRYLKKIDQLGFSEVRVLARHSVCNRLGRPLHSEFRSGSSAKKRHREEQAKKGKKDTDDDSDDVELESDEPSPGGLRKSPRRKKAKA